MKCDICNCKPQFGHNVSHSKRRTNRMFQPNVHPVTISQNGAKLRLKLCTRCIRTLAKVERTKTKVTA